MSAPLGRTSRPPTDRVKSATPRVADTQHQVMSIRLRDTPSANTGDMSRSDYPVFPCDVDGRWPVLGYGKVVEMHIGMEWR
jgi:hypothetical protein